MKAKDIDVLSAHLESNQTSNANCFRWTSNICYSYSVTWYTRPWWGCSGRRCSSCSPRWCWCCGRSTPVPPTERGRSSQSPSWSWGQTQALDRGCPLTSVSARSSGSLFLCWSRSRSLRGTWWSPQQWPLSLSPSRLRALEWRLCLPSRQCPATLHREDSGNMRSVQLCQGMSRPTWISGTEIWLHEDSTRSFSPSISYHGGSSAETLGRRHEPCDCDQPPTDWQLRHNLKWGKTTESPLFKTNWTTTFVGSITSIAGTAIEKEYSSFQWLENMKYEIWISTFTFWWITPTYWQSEYCEELAEVCCVWAGEENSKQTVEITTNRSHTQYLGQTDVTDKVGPPDTQLQTSYKDLSE